jgi:uncharacterized protein (DUF3084 family)
MIWTTLALLLLVVLGGFIAYYGDLQGRRWGKRRVSWFGLRPKHTAILITSLTGAFISMVSIAALLLISPPIRQVVLEGEQAIAEKARLDRQVRIARQQAAEAMAQAKRDQELAQEAHRQLLLSQKALQQAKQHVVVLRAQSERLREQVVQKRDELVHKTREVAQLERQRAHLEALNRHFVAQNHELAKQNLALVHKNTQLTQENKTLIAANGDLQRQNADLGRANEVLERTNQLQLEANQSEEQKAAEIRKQLQEVQDQLAAAQSRYAMVSQRLDEVYRFLAGSTNDYLVLRQSPIAVRYGAELARGVIAAHLDRQTILSQLKQLLQQASATALGYGAAIGDNGSAVRLLSPMSLTLTGGASGSDSEAALSDLAGRLEGSDTPTLLIVRSLSNTLNGEQVPVEVVSRTVQTVFHPGDELAEERIEGALSEKDLQQRLAQFLQTDVRSAAIKAGIVPAVDPVTGASQVGLFDPLTLAHLVQQAERVRGPLLIKAVAAGSITSADLLDPEHLHIEFLRAAGG